MSLTDIIHLRCSHVSKQKLALTWSQFSSTEIHKPFFLNFIFKWKNSAMLNSLYTWVTLLDFGLKVMTLSEFWCRLLLFSKSLTGCRCTALRDLTPLFGIYNQHFHHLSLLVVLSKSPKLQCWGLNKPNIFVTFDIYAFSNFFSI